MVFLTSNKGILLAITRLLPQGTLQYLNTKLPEISFGDHAIVNTEFTRDAVMETIKGQNLIRIN